MMMVILMLNHETLVLAFLWICVLSIKENTHIETATISKRASAAATDTTTIVIAFASMVLGSGPSIIAAMYIGIMIMLIITYMTQSLVLYNSLRVFWTIESDNNHKPWTRPGD